MKQYVNSLSPATLRCELALEWLGFMNLFLKKK
jgi:hypothetical protein